MLLGHDVTGEQTLGPNAAQEGPQFPLSFGYPSLLVLDLVVLDQEFPTLLDEGLVVLLDEVRKLELVDCAVRAELPPLL